ncbi:MAG: aminomethyl-transferring glycine dehydrogenase [Saprospiraceae bacterium]
MNKLVSYDKFEARHIGVSKSETAEMLAIVKAATLDELIDQTVPTTIRRNGELNLPEPLTEYEYLEEIVSIAHKNKVLKSAIGMGFFGTVTPAVILRNLFENPGWYTQYTPYQAEIAQGRLESLLNFQTMISELTGLPIANASLLDEGTAAAEAMTLFYHEKNAKAKAEKANVFLVSAKVYPHTVQVLKTRAEPLDIEVRVVQADGFHFDDKVFGVLLQYPDKEGNVINYSTLIQEAKSSNVFVTLACDVLSLALITPPGELGADCAVGTTQRLGVPMGFGGPHAAYFATKEEFKRQIPGRIIGVSVDVHGNRALRMALQTREQHIRREKATSNICTAQALLANMAAMYAVYHGPQGIRSIAERIHFLAQILDKNLKKLGFSQTNTHYFDTIRIGNLDPVTVRKLMDGGVANGINFYQGNSSVQISLDETYGVKDIISIISVFAAVKGINYQAEINEPISLQLPENMIRASKLLTHHVFNQYHSESKMMRYLKRLENLDLSLTHSMISLGSCTMKLNAAAEMIPVSLPQFANMHPFAPADQCEGYAQIFKELEAWLCECTGFTACSLQPNSGAQGEYTGLLTIRAYHIAKGQRQRNIALIPSSAHGTNPASAVMVGMQVVVVSCDDEGNIDFVDLKAKAEFHSANLSCLMVTYPSTHGVFETQIREICDLIHQHGGKVYMDGANMNAQVGLTSPGLIGADVCHLNLHKTFAIPHGGGGPGMGPICVNESLAAYLPTHSFVKTGGESGISAVSWAPYGSASILLISYAYIRMLGAKGVTDSTKYAILNANYIKARLEGFYEILYTGEQGRAAHELIVDLRQFKALNVGAEDVAKRLMDYGFHAPTLSFPVAGTIMIEPTESEDKDELDRFCNALLQIRKEIDEVATGEADEHNNVLHNAPHTLAVISADIWDKPYSREKAAFPLAYLRHGYKFWPSIGRVNNAQGDRNLVCTCPPVEEYA